MADCVADDFEDLNQNTFAGSTLSLDYAAMFVSLGVNLMATSTIALKVWYARCLSL